MIKVLVNDDDILFQKLLLARGGRILASSYREVKEKKILRPVCANELQWAIEIPAEKCEGISAKPFALEIFFGKAFPLAETRDGRNIKGKLDTRREYASFEYWRDPESGELRFRWELCKWQSPPSELGEIVKKAISEAPLTLEELEKKKEEERRKREEEERVRKREERSRKRANLKEWRRSLRNYLADLEKEVSRVRDLLKPRRSYEVIRDGFYEPRLGWPTEDDDC